MSTNGAHPLAGLGFTNVKAGCDYVAYPNVASARWVVPRDPALCRAGMRLYQPHSLRGAVLKRLIARGWYRGEASPLDRERLAGLQHEISQAVGCSNAQLAFSTGTPGAYRKIVVQVMDAKGDVLAYGKIGLDPLSHQAVVSEHKNLTMLARCEGLRGAVPEVRGLLEWQGRTVLLVSAGPTAAGPRKFGIWHRDFLQRLHAATVARVNFGQSCVFQKLTVLAAQLEGQLPAVWNQRYARALAKLKRILGPVELPVSTAHRDFAPWNTRLGRNGLFVFDWEAAEPAVPFHDAFHFRCIQTALSVRTRTSEPISAELAAGIWPEGKPYLPALFLAYLTDISLFYSQARLRAPHTGETRVWNWFGAHMDKCLESSALA